jgi:hypothetical protein
LKNQYLRDSSGYGKPQNHSRWVVEQIFNDHRHFDGINLPDLWRMKACVTARLG